MARYIFQLTSVTPAGSYVRLDSASGSTSPTAVSPIDSAYVFPGAVLHSDVTDGSLPKVAAGVATLYQKTLAADGSVTATATLTGTLVEGPGPGTLPAQTWPIPVNTDPAGLSASASSISSNVAFTGTYARKLSTWTASVAYVTGQTVTYRGFPFTSTTDHTSASTFASDWSNWTPATVGNPIAATTFDPRNNGLAQGTQLANRTNYARVQGTPMLISKLGVNVGTSSGNICLAVYDTTGTGTLARPNNRLATTGSVACPAAGEQSIALDAPVVVLPGDWFSFSADNATVQVYKVLVANVSSALSSYGHQAGAYPAPATASVAVASSLFYVYGVE